MWARFSHELGLDVYCDAPGALRTAHDPSYTSRRFLLNCNGLPRPPCLELEDTVADILEASSHTEVASVMSSATGAATGCKAVFGAADAASLEEDCADTACAVR